MIAYTHKVKTLMWNSYLLRLKLFSGIRVMSEYITCFKRYDIIVIGVRKII